MKQKANPSLKTQKRNKKMQNKSVLDIIVKSLSLTKGDYGVIGHMASKFNHNFSSDTFTEGCVTQFVIVTASAYLYAKNFGCLEINLGPYRGLMVPGPGPNGTGGLVLILETGSLSREMTGVEVASFLTDAMTFGSFSEAAVSANILAYALNSEVLSKFMQRWLDYDFLIKRLECDTNKGRTLITTPSEYIQVVQSLMYTRYPDREVRSLVSVVQQFKMKESKDPVVDHYNTLVAQGDFVVPEQINEPLFQEPIEPDEKIVKPFDPEL